MKKLTAIGWLVVALCLALIAPCAAAQTRQGVIFLEGMEETIEETLYESPDGFCFWYPAERLEAGPGEIDGIAGIVVSNSLSDDGMVLSAISEDAAAEYAADGFETLAAQSARTQIQVELANALNGQEYTFRTLIAARGRYLLAVGHCAQEAAEGNAKLFQRVLDSVALISPGDYVGRYTNDGYDEVIIEKRGDDYTMAVTLYRLASLDEGTLSFSGEGLVFHTQDDAGNPLTLTFCREDGDRYALRVDESSWDYLEPGTVFDGLTRAQ